MQRAATIPGCIVFNYLLLIPISRLVRRLPIGLPRPPSAAENSNPSAAFLTSSLGDDTRPLSSAGIELGLSPSRAQAGGAPSALSAGLSSPVALLLTTGLSSPFSLAGASSVGPPWLDLSSSTASALLVLLLLLVSASAGCFASAALRKT